ncbi:hypothetical protein ACFL5Z_20195 [Planctomycetota bacterium]
MVKNKQNLIIALLIAYPLTQYSYTMTSTDKARAHWSETQKKQMLSIKPIVVNFWNKEFPAYHMHKTMRELIDKIDNQEMLAYLTKKGIKPTKEALVTSDNLITYFRYKGFGTKATYAWIDLLKGDPDFIRAVLDWQTIQKENGFEFLPTYYLLFKAKLKTKKDSEVWADLFKATYLTLTPKNQDRKILMLWCLMPRIWSDFKSIESSMSKRFAFLDKELKAKKKTKTPYSQALIFNLYGIHFVSHQYKCAADYAKLFSSPKTALCFRFLAQICAKDLPASKTTLSEMELMSPRDEEMINTCKETIKELEEMKKKSTDNEDAIQDTNDEIR